jgi:hypothetical protein
MVVVLTWENPCEFGLQSLSVVMYYTVLDRI